MIHKLWFITYELSNRTFNHPDSFRLLRGVHQALDTACGYRSAVLWERREMWEDGLSEKDNSVSQLTNSVALKWLGNSKLECSSTCLKIRFQWLHLLRTELGVLPDRKGGPVHQRRQEPHTEAALPHQTKGVARQRSERRADSRGFQHA